MKSPFVFFYLAYSLLFCGEKKTICLNMIVKNESRAIEKCLSSVKPYIDYWVICDTGSIDGTQQIIQTFLKEIPGDLIESPWIDFSTNRNEALLAARGKADYLLFIDADEQLIFDPDFKGFDLTKDCYYVRVKEPNGSDYQRILFVSNHLPWHWEGVLHEQLTTYAHVESDLIEGVFNDSDTTWGFRSQNPHKYLEDALILEKALEKDPSNSRYIFYLGQSYANAFEYEKALNAYQRRVQMGGWVEEVFFSQYCVARLQYELHYPVKTVIQSLWDAYAIRPQRKEPLYRLSKLYADEKNYHLAYILAKEAAQAPAPADAVFVERWIYDWGALLQWADCSFFLDYYEECLDLIHQLTNTPYLPPEIKENLLNNDSILNQIIHSRSFPHSSTNEGSLNTRFFGVK